MPELEEHYADLKSTVAEFADKVVAPASAEHDRNHTFPYEVVAEATSPTERVTVP